MPDHLENSKRRSLNEVTTGVLQGPNDSADTETPPDPRHGPFIDWRTFDPATIKRTDVQVEELEVYRKNIDELLRSHEGQYVLIVGREIIAYFADFESAAKRAEREFRGRSLLVKKVARFQQIHSFDGVIF